MGHEGHRSFLFILFHFFLSPPFTPLTMALFPFRYYHLHHHHYLYHTTTLTNRHILHRAFRRHLF
jgi:hypothetical protein